MLTLKLNLFEVNIVFGFYFMAPKQLALLCHFVMNKINSLSELWVFVDIF